MCTRFQLVKAPAGLGDANHRHIEVAAFDHGLQRGKDLLVRQVPGRAEKDQGIGFDIAHGRLLTSPLLFPGGRRTRNASPTRVCPRSRPRRAN